MGAEGQYDKQQHRSRGTKRTGIRQRTKDMDKVKLNAGRYLAYTQLPLLASKQR
jgi:hypothetical protein